MHHVEWSDTARAELRAIWYSAPETDSDLLIWAAAEFQFYLSRDPHTVGESRAMGTRILISRPLAVWYHVRPDDSVIVRHVWRYQTA